jgi:high frequency lysogenization protein
MLSANNKNYYATALALAGLFQAVLLLKQLAKTGKADEDAFLVSINSIYKINADNIESIYGGAQALHLGLKELRHFFNVDQRQSPDVTRYFLDLVHLERKLANNPCIRDKLTQRIAQVANQTNYFPPTHVTLLSNLTDAYKKTLGVLNCPIQITGRANYLRRQDIMDKIHALLLAGLRSVVLWRQVGGTRWQLLFGRKYILKAVDQLLLET